jgi:choline dehydrogenase-like flavoprotein
VDCHGSARCQLGCPFDAKQSMALTYLPFAEARGVAVHSETRVDRVLWRGDQAIGVRAGNRRFGAQRGVIVAASATQTPLLLRRSHVSSRHLGRHFQAHPGVAIVGLFDEPVRVWSGATQGYEIDEYRESFRAKLETASLPPELFFAALPGIGRRWVRAMARSEHATSWVVALRAFAEGRVHQTLTGPAIDFTVEPRDLVNLRTALRRLAELSFGAGARSVLPGIRGLPDTLGPDDLALFDRAPLDPSAYAFVLSHLFGTARMSRRPADGVVGPDFAVHGRRNLFVVDSSIFPTNLGVNPQLSIMSVAMLAAERIAA